MTHLERLHDIPCICCWLRLKKRVMPVQVHHLYRQDDELLHYRAVPLCFDCHSMLHRESRRGFERQTKLTPIDLLAGTVKLLMED